MKLIIAIVSSDDAYDLVRELNDNSYYVTTLASTGGFLKKGNTTLMLGVEDDTLFDACEIIKTFAGKREETVVTVSPSPTASFGPITVPVKQQLGGATIFILPMEAMQKF